MDIGIIGLGRMGAGMAERWLRGGHRVVGYNRSRGPIDELAAKGLDPAYTLEELVSKLPAPRAIWIMLPAGAITQSAIQSLSRCWSRAIRSSTVATPTSTTTSPAPLC